MGVQLNSSKTVLITGVIVLLASATGVYFWQQSVVDQKQAELAQTEQDIASEQQNKAQLQRQAKELIEKIK